jgi:hypothetical protein
MDAQRGGQAAEADAVGSNDSSHYSIVEGKYAVTRSKEKKQKGTRHI